MATSWVMKSVNGGSNCFEGCSCLTVPRSGLKGGTFCAPPTCLVGAVGAGGLNPCAGAGVLISLLSLVTSSLFSVFWFVPTFLLVLKADDRVNGLPTSVVGLVGALVVVGLVVADTRVTNGEAVEGLYVGLNVVEVVEVASSIL